VDPALAPYLVTEVLHGIGPEHRLAVDPGSCEGLVEDAARRTDEGLAFPVLAVTGLLAECKHRCWSGPVSHHRLRCVLEQVAPAAEL
jgi:hypothetical protein